MKKHLFIFIFIFSTSSAINAQAIRKSYLEMTLSEKTAVVNAFYQLRDMDGDGAGDANPNDDDLIRDLAFFHANFFNFDNAPDPTQLDLHFNGYRANPLDEAEPTREIFFAWHRAMIFELEQKMQDINPNIGIPFWDSTQVDGYDNATVTSTINNTLFTPDFLGPFNSDWSLNRNVGSFGTLPTTGVYPAIFGETVFFDFSNQIERQTPHTGAHVWVRGAMITALSPRDPVFYLHHTYVDYLWEVWEETNQSSAYQRDDMIRYDGTYTFNGETRPSIDPDDMISSKYYGTFYAHNQLATLENYTVNNTFNSQENFYYQYTIQSGNNFTVPTTKDCKFESVNEIILNPGFVAESGSSFIAKIDTDSDINTYSRNGVESAKGVKNPFPYDPRIHQDVYSLVNNESSTFDNVKNTLFPNPFKDKIYLNLNQKVKGCKVEIYNNLGQTINVKTYQNTKNILLEDLSNYAPGIYFIKVTSDNKILISEKLIKL
ncbi:MAG: tyrosinase family protein [Flavobacteriaceae bacterium]|nr:tyrosinase family protein [Flavobacteriaceae bacterium]